ncbi:NAD-dependent epimerase/dehydratase family protein [Gracilibacillus timonensis]|uniref:NAD-dependent epimerase/dehydratase family protein n=1 Tax=Gracilibacillus timonensis TaxID=1816696 RepID=UPI0008270A62|nr:NAD(P)-dependent oxidoreductase [Gracilibacillus timonensis]
MTILITGGSGFVGINIIEKLLDEKQDIVNYATFPVPDEATYSFDNRSGHYKFIHGDVTDSFMLDSVMNNYDIETVIHGAVITPDFQQEQANSENISRVNYMGTVNVLEAARKHHIEKFIYISSVSVYGDSAFKGNILHEEATIPVPRTLYEITKYAAERTALRYKELFNMEVIVTRLGQVFGPWERYTGIRHTPSGPFQATRSALLYKEVHMERPGLRDWVYSRDVAAAIWEIWKENDSTYDIYNIGSGQQWTMAQWCEMLLEKIPALQYTIGKSEDNNVDFFVPADASMLSIKRLKTDIGYIPKYGIAEAYKDYMQWIEDTSDFWLDQSS